MSRNAAALALEEAIKRLQHETEKVERMAQASGGLVDPKYFRTAQMSLVLAAGDLHGKGLVTGPVEMVRWGL